jgi:hypothetical protein
MTNIWIAILSFYGGWQLYKLFCSIYPHLKQTLAYTILYVPSILFWGSGFLKDTFTLFLLSIGFVSFYLAFIRKQRRFRNISIMLICFYFISNIKGYVLIALIPNLILLYFLGSQARIKNQALKRLLAPVFIGLTVVAVLFFIQGIGNSLSSYSVDSLDKKAKDFEMWHQYLNQTEGGSGYDIGEVNFGFPGILLYLPKVINVTLFRPYIWEADNLVVLLSSFESLAIFLFSLYVLFQSRLIHLRAFPYGDPLLTFCFSFSLLMAVAVGATSYNFGALVRYKIPLMQFYLTGMVVLQSYVLQMGGRSVGGSRQRRPSRPLVPEQG